MPHQARPLKQHTKTVVVGLTGGSSVPCRKSICLVLAVPGLVEWKVVLGLIAMVSLAVAAVFVEPWGVVHPGLMMTALFAFSLSPSVSGWRPP